MNRLMSEHSEFDPVARLNRLPVRFAANPDPDCLTPIRPRAGRQRLEGNGTFCYGYAPLPPGGAYWGGMSGGGRDQPEE